MRLFAASAALLLLNVSPMLFSTPLSYPGDHEVAPSPYAAIVLKYCAETGVPVYIACGLIAEESSWDTNAVAWLKHKLHTMGTAYAGGLTGLAFAYHDEYKRKYNNGMEFDEFNPNDSIRIGLRYLSVLHDRFGTWRKALYFYACGYNSHVIKSVRLLVDRELGG